MFLPTIPLMLLLVFSEVGIKGINIGVVAAMLSRGADHGVISGRNNTLRGNKHSSSPRNVASRQCASPGYVANQPQSSLIRWYMVMVRGTNRLGSMNSRSECSTMGSVSTPTASMVGQT